MAIRYAVKKNKKIIIYYFIFKYIVSGAAALIYSHYDDITLSDVKEILLTSATELESLNGIVGTGGMLDLGSALNFDLDDLSGEEWKEKTPYIYTGNAPQIAAQIVNERNKSYLAVQFYDEDNDLTIAAYAEGQLVTDDFDNGNSGNVIKLNQSGVAAFEATIGTYTFYAIDSKGNETVKVVEITQQQNNRGSMNNKQPQMPGQFVGQMPIQTPIQIPNQSPQMQNLYQFPFGNGNYPNASFGGRNFNQSKQFR